MNCCLGLAGLVMFKSMLTLALILLAPKWDGSVHPKCDGLLTPSHLTVNPILQMLVMIDGYAASQGFFFHIFDALASRFIVIAVDQHGWGGSSRPDFTCKSTGMVHWFFWWMEKSQKLEQFYTTWTFFWWLCCCQICAQGESLPTLH